MNKDNDILWIAIGLFGAAFLFGLYFINEGLFHYDSVILAKAVEDVYRTGHLQPAVGGRYGIVIVNSALYFPFYLLGQNADLLTRFSSVLFYSLSIPVFFIFINALFNDRVQGFFAAVLLALTPFYLGPNTYGKEHGMSMFFFLCSMILINRGGDQKRPATVAMASLCFMAAVFVKESALFMFPFYFWLYFKPQITLQPLRFNIQKERLNGRLLAALILPFAVFLSVIMITYLGPIIQHSISGDEESEVHFLGFLSGKLPQAFMDVWHSFPSCFFIFGALGAGLFWRDRRYFLVSFFLAWACLIFLFGNIDGYVPRHLDMAVLSLLAFVSYFLAWTWRRWRLCTFFIFAALITMQLIYDYPALEFRHHYNGVMRLAEFIKKITPENSVILTADEEPFINYYSHRKTIKYPVGHWERSGRVFDEIDSLMEGQVPVYVVPTAYVTVMGGVVRKAAFLGLGPNGGTILSRLINKGVLKDVSSTEVGFALNNELKTKAIREIAKGDFDKVWFILEQTRGQFDRKLLDLFKASLAGEVLFEDYHHPELTLNIYLKPVYKLGPLVFTADEFTDKKTAAGLVEAIIHDSGIPVPEGKSDIEKLNEILKIHGLYKKFSDVQLPHPKPGWTDTEAGLTENALIRKNRFVLETVYPRSCPKHRTMDELVIGYLVDK